MDTSGLTLVSIEVFKILIFRRAFVTFLLELPPGIRLSRLSDPFQNQSTNTPKREMINIPVSFIRESSPKTVWLYFYTCRLNFLLFSERKELFAKLLQKNRELLNFSWRSLLKRLWLPPLSPCSSFIFHLRSGLPLKNQTDPRLSYPGNGRLRRI